MKFENLHVFKAFIEANLKTPFGVYNFSAYAADFERQVEETGANHYELSSADTISGNPETISFERIDRFYVDDEEVPPCDDFDYIETTIIF